MWFVNTKKSTVIETSGEGGAWGLMFVSLRPENLNTRRLQFC